VGRRAFGAKVTVQLTDVCLDLSEAMISRIAGSEIWAVRIDSKFKLGQEPRRRGATKNFIVVGQLNRPRIINQHGVARSYRACAFAQRVSGQYGGTQNEKEWDIDNGQYSYD
jgi:hypothetical protein